MQVIYLWGNVQNIIIGYGVYLSSFVIINILAFLSDASRYCIFVLLKRVVGDVFKRNFEESITIFALYS